MNEVADMGAKAAAGGDTSPINQLPKSLRNRLKKGTSAMKRAYSEVINKCHVKAFKGSLRRIDKTMPSSTYRKLASKLSRRHASIRVQLRTGHVALNSRTLPVTMPALSKTTDKVENGGGRKAIRNEKNIQALLRYVEETGRLAVQFG